MKTYLAIGLYDDKDAGLSEDVKPAFCLSQFPGDADAKEWFVKLSHPYGEYNELYDITDIGFQKRVGVTVWNDGKNNWFKTFMWKEDEL